MREGTNQLVGRDPVKIVAAAREIIAGQGRVMASMRVALLATLAPSEQGAFLSKAESGWSLQALTLDPDYVAAIAAGGNDWQLRL
ncbi:MAG: hypothetical protein WBC04_23905 [Candidatus Acidiferrales bacterium]